MSISQIASVVSEFVTEAIFELDMQANICHTNQAAETMFGWKQEESRGRMLHQVLHCQYGCPLSRAVMAGEKLVKYETIFLHRSGRPVYVRCSTVPITSDGILVGAAMLVTDITELKEQEHRHKAEAEQYGTEGRRKDEFISIFAHEIRNPLAVISNGIQILEQDTPGNIIIARGMIARQAKHLTRLVDDLLDTSRIKRGKYHLKKESIDLREAVNYGIELSRGAIHDKSHDLRISISDEPVRVSADHTRIAQAVNNLLGNAAKYTPPEGVISLTLSKHDGMAILKITDNGIGIKTLQISQIFDLFYQATQNLDRSDGGLGIGLTLVRNIMMMHGGEVEAKSDGEGKGSTFIARIPLEVRPTEIAPEIVSSRSGPKRKILVVDDVADAAMSMGLILGIFGHEVQTANNGRTAIAVTQTFRPEVVLLDIGIPEINGYEIARRVRKIKPDVVIIAVTGYGSDEDIRKSQEAGIDHHLIKPVETEELARLIR